MTTWMDEHHRRMCRIVDVTDNTFEIIIEGLVRLVEARYWEFYAFIKNTGPDVKLELK